MPFQSEAQRRYLYAKEPTVAKEFASKTPKDKNLPAHVSDTRQEAMKLVLKKRQNRGD